MRISDSIDNHLISHYNLTIIRMIARALKGVCTMIKMYRYGDGLKGIKLRESTRREGQSQLSWRCMAGFSFHKPSEYQGELKAEEEHQFNLNEHADIIILNYPYARRISLTKLFDADNKIDADKIKNVLAFRLLRQQETVQTLQRIYAVLFPELSKTKPFIFTPDAHSTLFRKYFQPQIDHYVSIINRSESTAEQRMYGLQILRNLTSSPIVKAGVIGINQTNLIDKDRNGELLSLYVIVLIKNGLDFSHLLNTVNGRLAVQEGGSAYDKVFMSKMIISFDRFEEYFSAVIISQILSVFTVALPQLPVDDIYVILRNVYRYRSKEAIEFGNALADQLLKKAAVPSPFIDKYFQKKILNMIIKYRGSLRLDNTILIKVLKDNPSLFHDQMSHPNSNKERFLSLLAADGKKTLKDDLQRDFIDYVREVVDEYSRAEELDEQLIIRNLKIIIKYIYSLPPQLYVSTVNALHDVILPKFGESSEVTYYSLLVITRLTQAGQSTSSLQKTQQQALLRYAPVLFQVYCRKTVNGDLKIVSNINKVHNIIYQLNRRNLLGRVKLPNIFSHNYDEDCFDPEVFSYFFMNVMKIEESNKVKCEAVTSAMNHIIIYLKSMKVNSLQHLYLMMDAMDKIEFDSHPQVYTFVEQCFGNVLLYQTQRDPNFTLPKKDLQFISSKMVARGYGSKNFEDFISKSLSSSNKFFTFRDEYLEKHKAFMAKFKQAREQHNKKRREGQIDRNQK